MGVCWTTIAWTRYPCSSMLFVKLALGGNLVQDFAQWICFSSVHCKSGLNAAHTCTCSYIQKLSGCPTVVKSFTSYKCSMITWQVLYSKPCEIWLSIMESSNQDDLRDNRSDLQSRHFSNRVIWFGNSNRIRSWLKFGKMLVYNNHKRSWLAMANQVWYFWPTHSWALDGNDLAMEVIWIDELWLSCSCQETYSFVSHNNVEWRPNH